MNGQLDMKRLREYMNSTAKVDISYLIHACIMMMIIVDVSQAQGNL